MAESQWYLEVNGQKIGPFALDHIQGLYADGEIKGYHQVTSDQLEGQWITVQELVDSLRVAAPPPPTSSSPDNFSAPPPPADAEEDSSLNIALPVLESAQEGSEESSYEISQPSFSPVLEEASSGSDAPPPPPESAAVFNSDFQPPPRPSIVSAAPLPPVAAEPETEKKPPGSPKPVVTKTLPPVVKEDPVAPTNDPAISMMSSLQLFKERQEKTTDTYDPTLVIQSDMLGRGDRASSPRMWMVAIIAGIILGCISWGVLKTLKNKTKAPSGTMTQISNHETTPPPAQPITRPVSPVTTNVTPPATSAFRPAEGPRETQHRLAPPRPLVAPSSVPAPVRQFEPPRDQQPQIDTAQPNEVPPQPQYAPQYQAYPPPGNGDPSNPQVVPQQPYVDPNNPTAPPVYPANGENFQNVNPGGQPPPQIAPPQGAPVPQTPPGMDNFNANPQVPQDQDQLLQQQQQQNQPPAQPVYPGQ